MQLLRTNTARRPSFIPAHENLCNMSRRYLKISQNKNEYNRYWREFGSKADRAHRPTITGSSSVKPPRRYSKAKASLNVPAHAPSHGPK